MHFRQRGAMKMIYRFKSANSNQRSSISLKEMKKMKLCKKCKNGEIHILILNCGLSCRPCSDMEDSETCVNYEVGVPQKFRKQRVAVSGLTKRQRQAYQLVHEKKYTCLEAASEMGIKRESLKCILKRAERKMEL